MSGGLPADAESVGGADPAGQAALAANQSGVRGRSAVAESFAALLEGLLAVRGATVAAVADGGGEILASRAADDAALQRTTSVVTSALAAATALTGLLAAGSGAAAGTGGPTASAASSLPRQVMVNLDAGPILLVPLGTSEHVLVLGLASESDVGRARFALKGIVAKAAKLLSEPA